MAFVDEIIEQLVREGVGRVGSTILTGTGAVIPRGDGPFLSLVETGGTTSAKTHNNTATGRPTLQLKARASDQRQARAMLKAAYNALGGENGLHNVILSDTFYLRIVARQEPTDTGQDEAGRATFAFNIEVEKQPS